MRLLRKMTVVASSAAMVAGIGALGVVYAGAASASATAEMLCVNTTSGPICAQAPPANGDNIGMQPEDVGRTTNWFYPTPNFRTIRGATGCMQADGNSVVLATCSTSDRYQLWKAVTGLDFGPSGAMELANDGTELCLQYAPKAGALIDEYCNNGATNGQDFFAYPS